MGTSASSRATLPVGPRGIDAARLAGERFRVKRHIGAGGSKEVFQAEDLTLRREVALAFIPGGGLRGSHARLACFGRQLAAFVGAFLSTPQAQSAR